MLEFLTGGGTAEYLTWGSQDDSFKVDGSACALSKILIDPNSIRTGFGKIEKGVAPDWVWAEIPGSKIQQPSPDHKPAFSVMTYVTAKYGAPIDGQREWQSNSRAAREAIKAIWEAVHKGAAENPGKWAVIAINGSSPMQVGPARINVPSMTLEGWANAPASVDAVPAMPPLPVAPEPTAASADIF